MYSYKHVNICRDLQVYTCASVYVKLDVCDNARRPRRRFAQPLTKVRADQLQRFAQTNCEGSRNRGGRFVMVAQTNCNGSLSWWPPRRCAQPTWKVRANHDEGSRKPRRRFAQTTSMVHTHSVRWVLTRRHAPCGKGGNSHDGQNFASGPLPKRIQF